METNKRYLARDSEGILLHPGGSQKAAKWVSGLFSPPLMAVVAIFLAAENIKGESAYLWAVLYVVLSILPPTFYIFSLVRSGEVTDFHLNIREQRTKPLTVILINTLAVIFVMIIAGAPKLMLIITFAGLLQALLVLLITLRWKISGHCTAAAGVAVFSIILFGEMFIPALLLVPLIAWSRIRMECHTFAQTVAGSLLGAVTVLSVLYITNII